MASHTTMASLAPDMRGPGARPPQPRVGQNGLSQDGYGMAEHGSNPFVPQPVGGCFLASLRARSQVHETTQLLQVLDHLVHGPASLGHEPHGRSEGPPVRPLLAVYEHASDPATSVACT